MPRQSHDIADAKYAFRSHVNLYLGRFDRRIKQLGEDYLQAQYEEVVARGGAWNYDEVALDAFRHALDAISGSPAIEEAPGESARAA